MGFRINKSFTIAPGVRLNVSNRGLGYSLDGKGVRVSRPAGSRSSSTLSIPGTGVSYTTGTGGGRPARPRSGTPPVPGAQAPPAGGPGMFAPAPEKELHRALFQDRDHSRLREIAGRHPEWAPLCAAFDGLLSYQRGDFAHAEAALRMALDTGGEFAHHPFVRAYATAPVTTLRIANGVDADLPPSREAVGLTLAELYQATGRPEQAIAVVEGLDPTFSAAVSLAELYSDAGRHDEVVDLTNNLANETDSHAFLLVMRARAVREKGMFGAAEETLKEALRRRDVDREIRNLAELERARIDLAQGRPDRARTSLDRIYAENASLPGLDELLRELDSADGG